MERKVKLVLLSLVLIAAAGGSATAQETKAPAPKPTPAPPSVDQILDKYVQALGGKAAIEKLNSRVTKGSFEVPEQGLTGSLDAYAKAPNKTASVVEIAGVGQFRQGFDGTLAWADNPMAGFRELSGQELANTKRSSEFYQSLKLRQLYPKITLKGTEKVGQRESYVVEADPGDGSLRRMYLDVETGLLVRNDTELDTATQGRMKIEVYFDDYKEVDGVKVPFTVRQVNPNISWVIKATEVRHNVPVDDAKFAKPSAQ